MENEIYLLEDEELENKYTISVKGAIISCIKHIRRYGVQKLPKDLWLKILFYALRGFSCQDDHLDITQRIALWEYLKDKKTGDPYIEQFIKDTEVNNKNALLSGNIQNR